MVAFHLPPLGYWCPRAEERLGNPPPKSPAAFNGQIRMEDPQLTLGVSKSMEYDTFCLWCSDAIGSATGRASDL